MISRTSVSALALILASAGSAAAFPATATTDLNIRSGPGTGHPVVDTLQAGDAVEVTSSAGGWYQLASGGWASGSYLDAEDSAAVEGSAEAPYEPVPEAAYDAEPAPEVVATYPSDFGPPAFYIGTDPYFWDDTGYYWYWRDGRRHQVSEDYWRDRDYRDFRWTDASHRMDFERRIGFHGRASVEGPPRAWDGEREERRIVPRIFD